MRVSESIHRPHVVSHPYGSFPRKKSVNDLNELDICVNKK